MNDKNLNSTDEQTKAVDDVDEKMSADAAFVSLRKGRKMTGTDLAAQVKGTNPLSELTQFKPQIPASLEQQNDFQSASTFIESIANEALVWKEALPEGHSPRVLAFLYGGMSIEVKNLTKVSFSGIRIEGEYNGEPCALLAHQSTVQILCYGPKEKKPVKKLPIGFFWDENEVAV